MKTAFLSAFALVIGLSIYAQPGDTYNCNGGHWVVRDEVAKCVAGSGTVPSSTIPLPTPLYTPEPLVPSCRPIDKQTPTPETYTINLPFVAKGN